ncbi:hypothetical protein UFOVP935_41 [uncultured Caudovirales phage]|uniref:Uncharacterized protein n=1 Tax=uncultured Caudovirales phage TaxID=2100421 RepID=A0A6J5PU16_9CAUD|nr:hypothetical protein UFOVP935_41 [uncultured Caudovirales phage]
MKFDITVLTLIAQGDQRHASDQITFYGVGESVRDFVAGSCKTTLGKLLMLPEDKSPDAWHLKYRTVVKDSATGKQVSDTRLITFPGMTRGNCVDFQRWAVKQLSETIDVIEEAAAAPASTDVLLPRNKLLTLIKMLWTRELN